MPGPERYPLTWPPGWPRTPARERGKAQFRTVKAADGLRSSDEVTLPDAMNRLQKAIEAFYGRLPVLSTNMELRLDGTPFKGQSEPSDPGAAIYFQLNGDPVVFACDRWNTVAGNVAAIAAHINALRSMDRWGVGTIRQLFTGYLALPAPLVTHDWRTVLENPATLEQAESTFKRKLQTAHPDKGGTHAEAAMLTAAITEARKVLK